LTAREENPKPNLTVLNLSEPSVDDLTGEERFLFGEQTFYGGTESVYEVKHKLTSAKPIVWSSFVLTG